jgi:glycosyltransferase involved in cell wall biosynthesis
MRVLVVASETPPVASGVARSVSQLVDGLVERGHHVDVLSAADDAPYFAKGDFRFSALGVRLPGVLRRLDQYDIINIHGPAPMISDVFLAALGAVPRSRRPGLVYTHHFTIELTHRWLQPALRSYDLLARGLARLADHVVVTSGAYSDILLSRQRAAKITVIPWGLDLDRFDARPGEVYSHDRPLRVLYVGQLREYKGAHIALQAIAKLDNVSLTIIGKGPCEQMLRRQLAESGASNIDIRGYVTDEELVAEYAWHDVVLLPSINRLEAFGIALLEGMASGCVPIASDLPGVRDLATDCGMLAAPNDADDLRWAIAELAARPELVARFRERAVAKALQYTKAATRDQYERTFEDVIAKSKATR